MSTKTKRNKTERIVFTVAFVILALYAMTFMDNKSGKKKDIQPHVLYWTASSAWIADIFYDYYLCTSDKIFLKEKAYPFMKEAAQFYEDFMSTDEKGYLKSYPSNSPENCASGDFVGANKTNICINATMDFALLKQLLNNLIDAEKVLNVLDEKDGLWKEILAKIPPYVINKDGAIAEWMDERFRDNYAHRHLSHLYPVFPGREITEDNKQLFYACKRALVLRNVLGLKEQTGWSLAHLANVYAVTGESKRAEQCLKLILRFCTGNNLFTYHNDNLNQGVTLKFLWANNAPFQIDANMGFTAAVQNMLVYSTENLLKIFSATPNQWKEISYGYALTRCGVKVKLVRKDKIVKLYLIAIVGYTFRRHKLRFMSNAKLRTTTLLRYGSSSQKSAAHIFGNPDYILLPVCFQSCARLWRSKLQIVFHTNLLIFDVKKVADIYLSPT